MSRVTWRTAIIQSLAAVWVLGFALGTFLPRDAHVAYTVADGALALDGLYLVANPAPDGSRLDWAFLLPFALGMLLTAWKDHLPGTAYNLLLALCAVALVALFWLSPRMRRWIWT